jgi:molecular chaperone Hsp33
MFKKDTLQRFIFENTPVRGEFIRISESFQTIVNQHDYPPVLRKLLGEALCAAGLLSAVIKFTGRLTIQFRGKGKLKLLLVQCDNHFRLRGLIKWDGEMTHEILMESFNEGVLAIMLDAGPNKGRYQGVVNWRGNSLAESIEGYFKDSEQLATKLWLAVDETSAAGYLLQAVPASDKGASDPAELERVVQLTKTLLPVDLLRLDYESILGMLYREDEIRIFPHVEVAFGCTCSRKRSADAILLLGKKEAEEEIKDKNSMVVTCDFCNKEYVFDRVEVMKIFEGNLPPPKDIHLH